MSGSSLQGGALGDISLIQDDLFGLHSGKEGTITLPNIHWRYHNPWTAGQSSQAFYDACTQVLLDVWTCELIAPAIEDFKKKTKLKWPHGRSSWTSIQARCISTGAILQCLVDIFSGNKGILSSETIRPILRSPLHILLKKWQNHEHFIAADLGRFVHQQLVESYQGSEVTEEQYKNPHAAVNQQLISVTGQLKGLQYLKKTFSLIVLIERSTILSGEDQLPDVSLIALILWEKCNQGCNLSASNSSMHYIFEGKHPTLGGIPRYNPDQTDPAHHFNHHATMFWAKLPIRVLLKCTEISSILVLWELTNHIACKSLCWNISSWDR